MTGTCPFGLILRNQSGRGLLMSISCTSNGTAFSLSSMRVRCAKGQTAML
jgi:hypothetical protein